MSNDTVQINYEQMEQVAQLFAQHAEAISKLEKLLQQHYNPLANGDWMGKGAGAFIQKMTSEIFPSVQRLALALQTSQTVTRQISAIFHNAEEEAASLFKGDEDMGSGKGVGDTIGKGGKGIGHVGGGKNIGHGGGGKSIGDPLEKGGITSTIGMHPKLSYPDLSGIDLEDVPPMQMPTHTPPAFIGPDGKPIPPVQMPVYTSPAFPGADGMPIPPVQMPQPDSNGGFQPLPGNFDPAIPTMPIPEPQILPYIIDAPEDFDWNNPDLSKIPTPEPQILPYIIEPGQQFDPANPVIPMPEPQILPYTTDSFPGFDPSTINNGPVFQRPDPSITPILKTAPNIDPSTIATMPATPHLGPGAGNEPRFTRPVIKMDPSDK